MRDYDKVEIRIARRRTRKSEEPQKEENKGRSLLEKIAEEERQNIGRNLKRLKGL